MPAGKLCCLPMRHMLIFLWTSIFFLKTCCTCYLFCLQDNISKSTLAIAMINLQTYVQLFMCLNLRPDNAQINARAAYDPSHYSWFEQFNKLHYKHRMVKHWMKKYSISFKRSIHLSLACTNNHCLSRIIIFQLQINSEGCFTSSFLKHLYCLLRWNDPLLQSPIHWSPVLQIFVTKLPIII